MNTTAAIFFLIIGQADGSPNIGRDTGGGGLAVIPAHYTQLADCEAAGEAARANNLGLSFLSYTCVPASINVEAEPVRQRPTGNSLTPTSASFSRVHAVKPVQALGPKCDEVCELIEAAE